ncbi:MAG: hypothetical protein EXX96DRAFT_487464 [Benjaminiella poitrasii]|nr:MAG: hypothetical protein EXX96DRAFT_487464 [Benjaminiella poitrasii]
MSIESRIRFYEEKYATCMCSETELSAWIRSIKGKGKPEPLTEGYIPPARSKLSDFFHYALSTKQRKRKATSNHFINTPAPAPKSSLSTFLKKATNSISTTYKLKKQQPKERIISGPAPISHTKDNTLNQSTRNRFSITSSLTRFSLSSKNNTLLRNTLVQVEEDNDISANGNTSILLKKSKKPRSQATILPHSPSSIFLDKLQPISSSSSSNREKRSSTLSKRSKSAKSQNCHSYILHNDSAHFSNCDIIQDNSTKVVKTPPSLLRTISSRRNRNSVDKKEETVKNKGEYHSILAARSHQKKPRPEEQGKEKLKKKRGSILAAPSLSTLRLLSQKTQALKRQSLRT